MATDAVEQARLTARTASENLAALHGLASVPGYTPGLKSRGWRRVLEAAPNRTRTMMSLFDVGYAIFSVRFTPKGFDVVSRDDADGIVLLRRLDRRPRAFVASHWTSQDDDDAAIRAMFDPASDLGTIRLAGARETAPPGLEATAPPPCDIQTPWPERVDLLCSSPTGGYAVLLDA